MRSLLLMMRGSARTVITKKKHGADRSKIYLFYAGPTCGVIFPKMTQCVVGFSFCLYGTSEKVKIQRIQ